MNSPESKYRFNRLQEGYDDGLGRRESAVLLVLMFEGAKIAKVYMEGYTQGRSVLERQDNYKYEP